MTDQDNELADLEAERDRLKSLIALYARPEIGFPELPGWFGYVLVGVVGLVGIYVAVEMLTGQIEPSLVIFLVVFLGVTAYISTRKINAFGTTMRVFDLLSYLALVASPTPGEPELRDRLSNGERKISQLRERRPRATL